MTMELGTRQRVLMESNSLNRYIEALPAKIEEVKNSQQTAVKSKYNHLVSSMKPIQRLVSKYKHKIQTFIQDLENMHKIHEVSKEVEVYSERAREMEDLNKELDQQVAQKTSLECQTQERVSIVRQRLNALKLENAELSYEITKEKKRIEEMGKEKYKKIQRTRLVPEETVEEKKIRLLEEEVKESQATLHGKVHSKVVLNRLMVECFKSIREVLKENQKKSHQHGLVGSMLFKLTTPAPKNKPRLRSQMSNQLCSVVYSTLRDKYKSQVKSGTRPHIEVDVDRFSEFSQLQTVGYLSLKPESFQAMQSVIEGRLGEILRLYDHC